jgi:hypothetical protein
MVQTVGDGPANADIAYARAMRAGIREVATYLQDLFGQKLTAVMAGVQDPKAVGKWARGEREPHPEMEKRLRAAFQVAEFLMQVESRQAVRAWFTGMNPQLDDHAPALVLGEEPTQVMQAARAFLAGG